jgi:hypothetical protein
MDFMPLIANSRPNFLVPYNRLINNTAAENICAVGATPATLNKDHVLCTVTDTQLWQGNNSAKCKTTKWRLNGLYPAFAFMAITGGSFQLAVLNCVS